jgi:undecaprenyl-phosphate 4-deoxy-4-formamido-L-arabinose transferase
MEPGELKKDENPGKSVSIVIPVYNSEQSLPVLMERLQAVLTACCDRFEVILVNDGSRDRSWEVIVSLSERFRFVHGINLMRNYGQHNALLCGIRQARYEITVTMDDDLQNPPEELPRLIARLEEGYDVVYGTPQVPQQGFWRNISSKVTRIALRGVMEGDIARQVSTFRIFRTEIREAFCKYYGSFVSIDVLLAWGTANFSSIIVNHHPRVLGRSNYALSGLLIHAANMMTGFSVLPLQVASLLGFACTIFGFCVLAYVLVMFLVYGSVVPGFPFLASIIAIFSGVQLLALGIIGEYLARMYFRALGRPTYTIRKMIDPLQKTERRKDAYE